MPATMLTARTDHLDTLQAPPGGIPGQTGTPAPRPLDPHPRDRPQPRRPTHQSPIASTSSRKRPSTQQPAPLIKRRRHMSIPMGIDPNGDNQLAVCHRGHNRSFQPGIGRHIRETDSTVTGRIAKLLSGHVSPMKPKRGLPSRGQISAKAHKASEATSHTGRDDHTPSSQRSEAIAHRSRAKRGPTSRSPKRAGRVPSRTGAGGPMPGRGAWRVAPERCRRRRA